MKPAPSHIPTARTSSASAVTVQSLENGSAVSHPSHRHLENADTAGVYPQPRPNTTTRLGQEKYKHHLLHNLTLKREASLLRRLDPAKKQSLCNSQNKVCIYKLL